MFARKNLAASPAEIEIEKRRLMDAPLVIAVVSFTRPHPKVPPWEQELSAGASAMNIVTAATALGYGANWLTGWFAFDRDVLASAGVSYLIVLEGVNDLGKLVRDQKTSSTDHDTQVREMIAAYEQIVARAHAHGIKVIGATILPYVGSDFYHPTPANEVDRLAINKWIRESGAYDGVADFDAVVRDPANPKHIKAEFDSGDHLHPNDAGYVAMADAIDLGSLLGNKK